MKQPDIDYGKAKTMLEYLAGATRLYVLKDAEKQKLDSQLHKLRRLTGKNVEQQLKTLEKDISRTLQHEKRLENQQETHDKYHMQLKRKVDALDKKLIQYRESRKQREARVAELEAKIRAGARTRAQQVMILKLDIAKVEHMFNEAKAEGATQTEMAIYKHRIDDLKAKLRTPENQ